MLLMENGRMDSSSEVTSDSSRIIMSLGGKSVKSCLSHDSSVTFQSTNASSIENTFSNCNGNSTLDHCETSNLINGVGACNNNCEENSYNSPNRINSSQCNRSSVQSSVCSSIENNLSTLSIKADTGEAPSSFTCNQRSDLSSKNCDKLCVSNDCEEESNRDCKSLREGEPKLDLYSDSKSVQDVDQSPCDNEVEEEDASSCEVTYISYESEHQMPDIMKLIQKDLSEPYSIYTYRYFIHNWPHLCFLAVCKARSVGAIVCKLDIHRKVIKRGYIAMLAVDESYRKHGIGSNLVLKAIRVMAAEGADEVVLETEITNQPALRLYENLGFVRDKRLFRYYLNGVDALRLKLWLR